MSENSGKSITRSRAPNFTKGEQLLLFHSMEPYTRIIECKKTDTIKQMDKHNAWLKVAEVFNANTKGALRSVDNLISCYRNFKSKLKKQHSEAKMLLEDPNKKEALLNALEENGKDWSAISASTDTPAEVCQNSFMELQKVMKRDELIHIRKVLGTGGGPPPSSEDPLYNIKKFIDPQIDGLYTIYDGDADLMDQFQKTKPVEEQIQPIEIDFLNINESMTPVPSTSNYSGIALQTITKCESSHSGDINSKDTAVHTPLTKSSETPNRTDFLRKKRAVELEHDYECASRKKRKNVTDSVYVLSQEKLELVQLQKKLVAIEIEQKTRLFTLELENTIQEHKFKEQLRQKELQLIDLKIKNESKY